jgi:hypothetical protein
LRTANSIAQVAKSIARAQINQKLCLKDQQASMDESTFLQRCKALAGDPSQRPWEAENLAGFFQTFRPDGHELEPLFADIPAGPDVFNRLRRVYAATTTPPKDPTRCDLYFIVRSPRPTSDEYLLRRAADHLALCRQVAAEFNARDLVDLLTPIPQIHISKAPPPRVDPNDNNSLDVFIYDVQCDWHGGLAPLCPHAYWMREGFYYINCDYYLAWYITWPWSMNSTKIREPFEPYFDLWLHGATLQCPSPDKITLFVPSAYENVA